MLSSTVTIRHLRYADELEDPRVHVHLRFSFRSSFFASMNWLAFAYASILSVSRLKSWITRMPWPAPPGLASLLRNALKITVPRVLHEYSFYQLTFGSLNNQQDDIDVFGLRFDLDWWTSGIQKIHASWSKYIFLCVRSLSICKAVIAPASTVHSITKRQDISASAGFRSKTVAEHTKMWSKYTAKYLFSSPRRQE